MSLLSNEFLNQIIVGDCLTVMKQYPDNSVDCCISSPPYWGLRDYGVAEQIGLENDYAEYLQQLVDVFGEVKRVLKPTGTLYVNLGDMFNTVSGRSVEIAKGKGVAETSHSKRLMVKDKKAIGGRLEFVDNYPKKSLLMIPERFAIMMIELGWILRNKIVWHKPNQMPQSATDRFTIDYETIFFFVKQPTGYYFNQELEPYAKPLQRWGGNDITTNGKPSNRDKEVGQNNYRNRKMRPNPEGKNIRSVWSINTVPFKRGHFATFPEKLVERMIKAGCPENGIVLDPFSGAGTTAIVAQKLNRNYTGIELNSEYVDVYKQRQLDEFGMFLYP